MADATYVKTCATAAAISRIQVPMAGFGEFGDSRTHSPKIWVLRASV